MDATNKKIDAIRRLILGSFYTECRDNPLGVKREDLEAHFEELKREGCVGGDCGFDEMIKLCQLKSHYPTCLSGNRGCIEKIGERSTGVKKFYYDQYKRAKDIEDEESSSDEEEDDEIECPICMMNEDENGVRLVEMVTNPEEEQGKLSCGHLVHKSCLIKTAVSKGRDRAECPLCNTIFELNEVQVPVRDASTLSRDNMRRAVFNGTQMGRTFEEIADVYGLDIEQLLERIGMTAEEASAYYSIPLESIEAPVNRRLDFEDEGEGEGEEISIRDDVIENIIDRIENDDIENAVQMTQEKIDEEGNNNWVTADVIREILNGILGLDGRSYLNNLVALFLLAYHDNIIHYQNDMDEFIANSILQMFRASKRGIAKIILLHIIKKDSIGMYYILVHILKGYDRITPSTENQVVAFIFEAYNGFTERDEDVAEIHNETDGNTVLKGFLNDVLEEIHNWNNTSDVSDVIREWFDKHYPGEFEREGEDDE